MFIYIGKNKTIRQSQLIGVFDIENASRSSATRAFLKRIQEEKKVLNLCTDLPKSIILTDEAVYISPSGAASIMKRTATEKRKEAKTNG
ncbi:MAG TPA: DUF370 domain-containing protein [Bacillota bacterium]|nr:DUF370 domain-containing protein [Bacillota bacterium]